MEVMLFGFSRVINFYHRPCFVIFDLSIIDELNTCNISVENISVDKRHCRIELDLV